MKQIWGENALYLDLARLFFESDPGLAGLIASREFEYVIKRLCKENKVKLTYKTVDGIYWIYIPELAENLRTKKAINPDEEDKAKKYWELRNLLVHGSKVPDEKLNEVQGMIDCTDELSRAHNIRLRTSIRYSQSKKE